MFDGIHKIYPDDPGFDDPSLLSDRKGQKYEVSEGYYKNMIEQLTVSGNKKLELIIAKELLSSKLHRLTDLQQTVIYYTMLGESIKTIAKIMKLKPSSVQTHLEAAKKKLAKIIKGTKQVLQEGLKHDTGDTH